MYTKKLVEICKKMIREDPTIITDDPFLSWLYTPGNLDAAIDKMVELTKDQPARWDAISRSLRIMEEGFNDEIHRMHDGGT
jgi:hypothetical protein